MHCILVASDLSQKAGPALQRACQIASEHCAALHLLHVAPRSLSSSDRGILAEELSAISRAHATQYPCIAEFTSSVRTGKVTDSIRGAAEEQGADLIVLGGHGETRWVDSLFGTAAEQLLRTTARPVLIVQSEPLGPYRRVLAAVDEGPTAKDVLQFACTVASADTVFVVHAFMPSVPALVRKGGHDQLQAAKQQELEQAVRKNVTSRKDLTVHVHPHAMAGDPLSVIIRAWDDFKPDLLVISTHARSGLSLALRGSFADMMIEDLPVDILVHRLPANAVGSSVRTLADAPA